MTEHSFTMTDPIGVPIHVYEWLPEANSPVRGIVQISHGMCETGYRYARLAGRLNAAGYVVYAGDHRGHGKTAGRIDLLGDAGRDGFYWMRRNLLQIAAIASGRHPGVPVFLLGHSMGSFLTQKLMCQPGSEIYAGYILSGSNGPRGMLRLGEMLAKAQLKLMGERHRSVLLNGIVFGPYNRSFSSTRTAFDWLSSDTAEVDGFIADPFCGAICTTRFFRDFFRLLQDIHTEASLCSLCKDKPVYLFSGEKDPVGMNGEGVLRLAELYRSLGVSDLEVRLYPGGRHEMLNERDRGQVTDDLLDWLVRHLPPGNNLLRV
ncbi:alpha-beta hydrolase superfamily lysophospholipase [Paenibacillus forsythiae]|uniref:Alpha-beta hydrolase superfamily lysophospholipase n=1 Tax=Paenibacillus forsythiae TaxID=365616 RepID=A0ABU3H5H2_9BACL|nr:alpha/beta hydrolase [Paenibacillus forsythiae]MDT3425961.1 alpha-beta hydrolase superfamily lysophospholipase [Paenibacillus forsythiae]